MYAKTVLKKNYSLKKLTTIKTGGPAKYFLIARKAKNLVEAINWAKKNKINWYVIGDGSNLIPSDKGFNGLIIKNEIRDIKLQMHANDTGGKVTIGAGENLTRFIFRLNRLGLKGMEKMAGIPGTVGGAIYGCAGAYGQEIKDYLTNIKIFDGKKFCRLSKKQCRFTYRESIFKKKKNFIILAAEFKLKKGNSQELTKTSKEIIKMRKKKYLPGLLCPGSFFKNVLINNIKPVSLRQRFLQRIDKDKINNGKVSSGYLLEQVGAKGTKCGAIKVAKYHGNLIYNTGKGNTLEVTKLAEILKNRVREKFGIIIEEEIQYL